MIKQSISLVVACAAMVLVSDAVHAAVQISSVQGGSALAGATYLTFDTYAIGSTTPVPEAGVTVSFLPVNPPIQGQPVAGAVANQFAAPFLSGNNNLLFGGNYNGADTTTYLTTGASGSVEFSFASAQVYFGLLWGSIDSYNKLAFYNGNSLVRTVGGSDVANPAAGNQALLGTRYVNIKFTDGDVFTKVVAYNNPSQYAFEFDNVAFGSDLELLSEVPEPASLAMWGVAALGAFARRKLRRSSAV